jgi:hypothetical protein
LAPPVFILELPMKHGFGIVEHVTDDQEVRAFGVCESPVFLCGFAPSRLSDCGGLRVLR